jgi:LysR family transcriptional regulator, hydrogen peroxide-inducible genes activator
MNLRDLEYLVAVADHRHFGKAAAACYVSQPTLSTQIKKLETELGVGLLERGNRRIILTTVGEEIVERARDILRQAQDVRNIARRAGRPRSGPFRLGIFPTLAPYLLPHVVPGLHREFPDLELLLSEEKTEVLLGHLYEGSLDAAVLALPIDHLHLEVIDLFSEDFVLAVPVAGHRLSDLTEPVQAVCVTDEPMLLLDEGHCLRDQVLDWCRGAGAEEFNGFRATSLETLRHMVAYGVGPTLLPRLAVSPPVPVSPTVRILPFADPVPHRDLGLVFRTGTGHRDLLPEVAEVLRTLPPGLVRPLGPEDLPGPVLEPGPQPTGA